ncbi:leucine-rich repeat and immunoglobulin-like domain containing-NOGO receptor-interacting protein 4 [Rhinophrynus dorsalis]
MALGRYVPKMNHHFEPPMFVMCTVVLFRALCYCCPYPCECPTNDNVTLCRHRLLSLVPAEIPFSSHLLDLSYNRIRSVQHNSFTHLQYLQELDLSHNQLSRVEPEVFSSMTSLRILMLHHNQLKLLPPRIFLGMPDLSWLDVRGNQLVILLDQTFQGLQKLKHLEAGENPLVFISPGAFLGMPQLQRLGLEKTKLSSVPSRALSALPQLSELRLGGVNIPVLQNHSFPGLPWLRVLDMDLWPSLASLEPLSLSGLNLSSLSLTRCNLSSIPDEALKAQVYLRRLDLSHNPIPELPDRGFSTLKRLEELRLSGGRLRSIPYAAFHGLDHLRILDLSVNPLHWLAEDSLPFPGVLENIVLSGTMLSCDCRLCWLLHQKLRFGGRPPICAAPTSLRGMVIPEQPQLLCPEIFTCQPPRIVEPGPRKLRVQEGERMIITCHSLGVPEPSIHWVLPQIPKLGGERPVEPVTAGTTKRLPRYLSSFSEEMVETVWSVTDDQDLGTQESELVTKAAAPTVQRISVLPNGSLQFLPVQTQDAGAYLCLASNVVGNDSAWVHLEVVPFNGSEVPSSFSAVHGRLLVIITAGGILPFISSVTLCFIFMFLWSRGRGNIKHTAHIDYVPRTGRGTTETEDNKFTMKLI